MKIWQFSDGHQVMDAQMDGWMSFANKMFFFYFVKNI